MSFSLYIGTNEYSQTKKVCDILGIFERMGKMLKDCVFFVCQNLRVLTVSVDSTKCPEPNQYSAKTFSEEKVQGTYNSAVIEICQHSKAIETGYQHSEQKWVFFYGKWSKSSYSRKNVNHKVTDESER